MLAFLVGCWVLPGERASAAPATSRLLVYLEVPPTVEAVTELVVSSISLRGPHHDHSFDPLYAALASSELEGRQVLLLNREVSPGAGASLTLHFSRIVGHVGVASVSPSPDPVGVEAATGLELRPGACEIVFLEWKPAAIDGQAEFHRPNIGPRHAEVPPLGSLAFVTSRGTGAVMFLDRLSGRVVGGRWVDADPRGMAYLETSQTLFVALADQDAIGVLEGLSLRLNHSVPLQFGDDPERLLLSEDGSTLFVLNTGSRTLAALSSRSLQPRFRVPVGENPRSLAQDPVTGHVNVACEGEGTIQVFDPVSGAKLSSFSPVSAPREILIDPRSRLFVGDAIRRVVHYSSGIDGRDGGDVTLCSSVSGLIYSPKTRSVFAGLPGCRQLAVIRPEADLEFASVDLPAAPGLMTFDREFRQILVTLPETGEVALCSPRRGVVDAVVQVGERPFEVVVP